MQTKCFLPIVFVAIASCLSGCKSVSNMVRECADWIDPDCVDCSSQIPNCSLCGQAMPTGVGPPGYPIAPDGGCARCNGLVPSPSDQAGMDPNAIQVQLSQLRNDAGQTKELVDKMSAEIANRNEALIQSRAEFARVQGEIESMRGDMQTWQQQAQDVHERIRQRDVERQAALSQLTNSLSDLVDESDDDQSP